MQDERAVTSGSFVPIWLKALGDETAFDELVSPEVTPQGSIFAATIKGRENVWTAVQPLAASLIRCASPTNRQRLIAALSNGSSRQWVSGSMVPALSVSTAQPD
jgi:hypothetical protein